MTFAIFTEQGKTWMRLTQHYIDGAMDEELREVFLLAMSKAAKEGATSPASALKLICQGYLR